MMLSMPDDWQTYASWIEEQGTEGREALQGAFRELEQCGYLSRQRVLDPITKKFTHFQWMWFPEPYDGFPSDGFPAAGFSAATKYTLEKVHREERTQSKETKETSSASLEDGGGQISAVWKPKKGTKEQKLAKLHRPSNFPSEDEFDAFLYSEGLDAIITYRPDLYLELCQNKWHFWQETHKKWFPIANWPKFVIGLNTTITETFHN